MNDPLKFKPVLNIQVVEDDIDYREFAKANQVGLRFIPTFPSDGPHPTLNAGFGDFAKWIKHNYTAFPLSIPKDTHKIVLHGADIWLPLIQLASDTSMQIFLSMVSSYLYDKAKGAIKTETNLIHMSVIYEDKKQKMIKKFEFSGDREALTKVMDRFDLDNFFHANS
jgi:hypothetical protein